MVGFKQDDVAAPWSFGGRGRGGGTTGGITGFSLGHLSCKAADAKPWCLASPAKKKMVKNERAIYFSDWTRNPILASELTKSSNLPQFALFQISTKISSAPPPPIPF